MPIEKFVISPDSMTTGAWNELYNASSIMPRTYEASTFGNPRAFRRTKKQIMQAVRELRGKIESVRTTLCADDRKLRQEWIADLLEAIAVLEDLVQ